MVWIYWFLFAFFVGQLLALFFGYCIGIQLNRTAWPSWLPVLGGKPFPQWLRKVCKVIAAVTLFIDMVANLTVLSVLFWELPEIRAKGEWTFSTRLERLWSDTTWRGRLARPIARLLNFIDPLHAHIKAAIQGNA